MAKVYYNHLHNDEVLPEVSTSAISRIQLAKWVALTNDFNPLYIDEEYAKSEGFGGIMLPGSYAELFLENAFMSLVENATIFGISVTYFKFMWPGDRLLFKAHVSQKSHDHGSCLVTWACEVHNQNNHDPILKGDITAIVWNSAAEEKQHKDTLPKLSAQAKAERLKHWKQGLR